MRLHLLVPFTTVEQAERDAEAIGRSGLASVVLASDTLDRDALADIAHKVRTDWGTRVGVLAAEPAIVPDDGRSFVTSGAGRTVDLESGHARRAGNSDVVVTALDVGEAQSLPDAGEVAVVLRPEDVDFDELAGLVDHLIVDARVEVTGQVDRTAVFELARRAARQGRTRADARRWRQLADVVTLAPNGDGLRDARLELPEGWSVGEPDLVERGSTVAPGMPQRRVYYAQPRTGDPYHDAPLTHPTGGVLYLDDRHVGPEHFATALAALGVSVHAPYAAFVRHAEDVVEERFLTELRVFLNPGMLGLQDDDPRAEQSLPVPELLAAFAAIAGEDQRLYGALGEDGDDVMAALGFGLWTENAINGVLRCWSRPVLVLK